MILNLSTFVKMTSVNSDSWRKSASYQTISNSAYSLLKDNNVDDVVQLVFNKRPIDTGTTFQEAQYTNKSIVDQALLVEHLEPMDFLTFSGKVDTIDDVTNSKKNAI